MTTECHVPRRDLGVAVRRGGLGRCPNCGKAGLFRSYLRQVDSCPMCHEAFGHIRADDGPPWLTTIVVGHVVVAIALLTEGRATWPLWMAVSFYVLFALVLALLLLPRAKGVFIGAIWASKLAKPDSAP